MHTHILMHTQIQIHTCMHTHVYINTCTHTCTQAHKKAPDAGTSWRVVASACSAGGEVCIDYRWTLLSHHVTSKAGALWEWPVARQRKYLATHIELSAWRLHARAGIAPASQRANQMSASNHVDMNIHKWYRRRQSMSNSYLQWILVVKRTRFWYTYNTRWFSRDQLIHNYM